MVFMNNPFSSKLPALNKLFLGRESEVKDVVKNLNPLQFSSIAILGGRGIGKTSLFLNSLNSLKESFNNNFHVVIIDSGLVATFRNTEDAFSFVFEEVNRNFPQFLGTPKSVHEFSRSLVDAENNNPNEKFLLVWDYAENLYKMPEWDFFTRSLTHLIQGNIKNFAMVFMGRYPFMTNLRDVVSPLVGLLEPIYLSSLSKASSLEIINWGLSAPCSENISERIITETGGHPLLLQWFMENLFNEYDGKLNHIHMESVEILINRFYSERTECKRWFEKFTLLESQVYGHLTNNVYSYMELSKMGLLDLNIEGKAELASEDQVMDALSNLWTSGFIVPTLNRKDVSTRKIDPNEIKYFASGQLMSRYYKNHIEKNNSPA